MARFIHDGKSIDYTPAGAVTAGDVIVQADLVGIAKLDIASGALGALAVEGVFEIAKEAPLVIAAGDKVYWVAANSNVNKTALNNIYVGKAVKAAADAATTVLVRLDQ